MTTWARNVGNVVTDLTTTDPTQIYAPDIATQFVIVPDGTQNGWVFPPPAPYAPPPPQYKTTLSRPDFLLLFTSSERIAIRASADPGVVDWVTILSDSAVTEINLGLQQVQDGLAYLVSAGLLTVERKAIILQGMPL